jgi:hypothetical protein
MVHWSYKGMRSELSPDGGVVGTTDIGRISGNEPRKGLIVH